MLAKGGLPMPNSAVKTFNDPYEYQSSIRAGDVTVVVTEPGEFRAELTRIDLRRLWMQRSWTSLPLIAHSTVHKSRSAILFPTDAEEAPYYHSGMEVSQRHIVFYSAGAEHHHRTSTAWRWGAMSLSPEDLAAAGRALVGRDLTAPLVTHLIRPPPHLISRLRILHAAVGDLAATVPEILAHAEVVRAMEQQLVRAMIACLTDAATAESFRPSLRRLAVMRQFEQLLEANQDQPLYLPEVCVALGVTDRTLRLHCHEHLGMSPHRYLWLRRMHLARRALALADGAKNTVTEIANDHGFGELGRFAVSYRQLFGESPSVTLRRRPGGRPTFAIGRFHDLISVPA
jgi:AraC-like DNA-binding protein